MCHPAAKKWTDDTIQEACTTMCVSTTSIAESQTGDPREGWSTKKKSESSFQ